MFKGGMLAGPFTKENIKHFVKGLISAKTDKEQKYWEKAIEEIIDNLNVGGQWFWPSAGQIVERKTETEYWWLPYTEFKW